MTKTRTGRVLTIALATAGSLLLWAAGAPLSGRELLVGQGGTVTPIGPDAIVPAAVIAGVAAWVLLAMLEQAGRQRLYRPIASVVLVLSLAGPLTAAVDPATALSLAGLHTTVGMALIIGLPGLGSHAAGCKAVRTGTAR
ncbi:DUF6069 family protein [Actinoplanes sp. G11-F43]|uniref:DUF6069 family protein n=1 Tax=Actinoplanes sp. G11-F43 TaxID=3424130 RepID=UPI003D345B90